jgi:peptide/nickel transport system substrate-binding protein
LRYDTPLVLEPQRTVLRTIAVITLVFIIGCASSAPEEPTVGEKEVTKDVVVEKEVEKPIVVEKEVVKEVVATPTSVALAKVALAPTPAAQPTAAPAAASMIKTGGIIIMGNYAATSVKAIHEWGFPSDMTNAPLFNTLLEFNPETPNPDDLRGDLARSWEAAADGVTFTFHLRENAKWHDGKPVLAEDVLFSLHSMIDHKSIEVLKDQGRSAIVRKLRLYTEWPDCCRAIDNRTVEIRTKFPSSAFLSTLALETLNIMAAHSVLDEGNIQTLAAWENLNGSGPFKFTSFDPDVSSEFEKNEEYWKEGYPRVDGMKHFPILEPGTATAAYQTGQVLMSNAPITPLSHVEALQLGEDSADTLTVYWGGPGAIRGVVMNTTKAPFDDVNVRRAVSLAIHRQPFIQTLSKGKDLMGTPLPPGQWYSRSDEEISQLPGIRELNGKKHPEDIAAAKKLLAQAGYEGSLKVTLSARNCCMYPDIAQILADQLNRSLGWDVTIKTMESAAGFAAYDAGDFQFASQGSSYNLNDPDAAFRRYIPGTLSRWAGGGRPSGEKERYFVAPGIQELFDAQKQEPDLEKRIALVRQAEDILLNEDNAYPAIFWTMRHQIVNHKIQGFNMSPTIYAHLKHEELWCDPACE